MQRRTYNPCHGKNTNIQSNARRRNQAISLSISKLGVEDSFVAVWSSLGGVFTQSTFCLHDLGGVSAVSTGRCHLFVVIIIIIFS
jgi:hypothetical protein